ncbi:hypothetical protein [Streptomyces sp. NPDC091278]
MIARTPPGFRRRGAEGLRSARARGFTEVERYVLPGDTVPFVALRLG